MRNINGKTMIFYSFQGCKSVEHNVTTFKKSAPSQPKIRDVLYELPLDYSNNSYHFRFKSQFRENQEKIIGWIDISNLLAKVPIINNSIFVKILTLPTDKDNKIFNIQKLKAIGLINPQQSNGFSNSVKNLESKTSSPINITQNYIKAKSVNIIQNKNKSKTVNNIQPKKEHKNLLEGDDDKTHINGNIQEGENVKVTKVPTQTAEERLKAFQDECKRVEDAEKNERLAEKQFEEKLLNWGYSGHKTINNITTLLTTLHEIWPDWKPVSLSDMLRPDDIGKLLKKAVVKVHPDKNQKKDFRTKYLSKRIFELLKESEKMSAN